MNIILTGSLGNISKLPTNWVLNIAIIQQIVQGENESFSIGVPAGI